ncbi:MAG: hypothetical protein ACP5VQ_06865 [Phycisphaerae bacterium]
MEPRFIPLPWKARINGLTRRIAMLLALGGLLLVAGCSQQTLPPRQMLAIPPVRQEIQILNGRAALLAKVRLTGNVSLTLTNRDGSTSNFQAHAVLLVDQNRVPRLLLVGTYLGQNAFEMGMNRSFYWLIDHTHKVAYVGRVGKEYRLPTGVMPLRPQRVLDMLGITPLILTAASRVALFNIPRTGRYNLLLLHSGGDAVDHIERQISISRYTGQICAVRLYDRRGRAVAYANLSRYAPIGAAFDGVKIPFHIVIHYIDAHAEMDFQVNHAVLQYPGQTKFIFSTPSFQGLKTVDMDNPANWTITRPAPAAAQ